MHAVAAALSDPLPPPGAALLAPGFRFHPTDEELVSYYLTRRVRGRAVRVDAIAEVDIYKCEPWELPGLSRLRSRDLEWYFFSPLDRKYASRSRTNRSTAQGYWKTTGKDRPVRRAGRTVGMKKTLVYHSGRAPHGARTNWVMHEYRLEEDEAAQSRLPQDGYVVCRIFQKTGSGPQNGAQYGAPFIEEEWEEDETINEALVLMPDSGDDEINNHAHDKDFLEVNDFLQTEGIGGQKEGIAATFLVGTNEKSSGNYAEDPVVFLDEMLKDPSFIDDMVDYNSQAQINNSRPTCPDDFGEQVLLKDSIRDSPNKNDGYLEFSGTEDAINTDHSNVGYLSYPLRTSHALNFGDGEGESRNLQKDLDAEFLDNADSSCDPDEMVRMTLVDDCLDQRTTVPLDFSSRSFCQSVQDLVFCDVCGDDVAPEPSSLNDQNRVLSPPISDLPAFDFDDELMAYFDAMDDNLQFGISGFPESFEQRNSPILDQSNSKAYIAKGFDNAAIPQLSNADLVAGASSILPLSDNQLEDKHEEILVGPGATVNIEDKEAITNRLVNFLGSISAPPAFASEFPAGQEKYFGQLAGTYEGSLLNVSPSLVPLHDFTATSGTEDWLLRKHGSTGLLLSYSIADNVSGKTSCFGPLRKLQEWTTSLMLRCGFYPFFLSGLVLTVSYKVGMCLYGKNS